MQTYIAILRGINVSGQKLIKMDKLREALASLGFSNLATYIQSGNVVFQAANEDNLTLAQKIHNRIEKIFGFDVPVLVRSLDEWQQVVDNFPFEGIEEMNRLLVTFLEEKPAYIPKEEIDTLKASKDEVVYGEQEVYLYVPDGYGNSKLDNNTLERKLKVRATTRNWKTTLTLLEMVNELK
ncbi:MAG: DUF1697 domain-containing protein [Cyclobacteriaceae bacterium]|nr:DUF1697 domain-containing protein [Cyclobacteriaceae bacterium]